MKKNDMRKHTCCFSGHRRIPDEDLLIIKQKLMGAITSAIKDGYIFLAQEEHWDSIHLQHKLFLN